MGYYLYDAQGYVGDLASIHGLQQVTEYVRKASQVHQNFDICICPDFVEDAR